MGAIAPVLGAVAGIAGTVLSGVGAIAAGQQQANMAEAQAAERKRQAQEQRAASQRDAIRMDKEKAFQLSRLQARAANSGGGAADQTVARLAGGIAQEGEYQTAGAIYQGESRGRVLEAEAELDRMAARNARIGSIFRGASTILGGFQSFASSWTPRGSFSGYRGQYTGGLT